MTSTALSWSFRFIKTSPVIKYLFIYHSVYEHVGESVPLRTANSRLLGSSTPWDISVVITAPLNEAPAADPVFQSRCEQTEGSLCSLEHTVFYNCLPLPILAKHYFLVFQICYAINLGKEIIEVQKDPEALARLMLSVPLTNDGKYVLLNDQADDTGGSPSENRGAESEA